MSELHQNLLTYGQGKFLPWNKSVKQFKLLRATYDSSAILNFEKRTTEHIQKIKFELYNHTNKFR